MTNYYSIDRLSKNFNVLQVGTGNNSTTLLCSDTKKVKIFWEKKQNKKKQKTFKDFASTYNVEILNSLNLELQLKDTEFAIKNKLKKKYYMN